MRAIFANIRKFLRYLLSSNIGEVMTMFFGVLLADVIGLTTLEGGGVVLPLLATQILWINMVTDGAPALALGVDPADPDIMQHAPRPREEGVITRRMWAGIFFIGTIMAIGTLYVLDASLPGGLIEGKGDMRYAQTMVFTTLVFFSLFTVFNARSDERSAFVGLFANKWLWAAVVLAVVLQVLVVYQPFLQQAFSTVSLTAQDWLLCLLVASSVLWLSELRKLLARVMMRGRMIQILSQQFWSSCRREFPIAWANLLIGTKVPPHKVRYHAYPFELSGGMCQRVVIAIALACKPQLLIADEPTTGLDVTTQKAVMELVRELTRSEGMSTLLITHDLGLAGEYCDRIVVMEKGEVVEQQDTAKLFTAGLQHFQFRRW